jgi:glycosyltransferase involved in cell wall biosynthesis
MTTAQKPLVHIVGGPDVDSRLELMEQMRASFRLEGVGSSPSPRGRFLAAGFGYHEYRLSRAASPLGDLRAVISLLALFRRLRPQLVHAFDTKPGVLACLAARAAGVPLVVGSITGLGSLYTNDDRRTLLLRRIYQPLQRLACRASDLTIFQNHDDLRQLIAYGVVREDKARVIPGSGVRTDRFDRTRIPPAARARVREELGIPQAAPLVTMVSRLIRSKGIATFAAAAGLARQGGYGARFLLVGADDSESGERLLPEERAQLAANLTWAGPRQDIAEVLAASDIFVLPSFYREGIPRVLLEAAATGLPLVTANSPGCNEVVEDGVNGFVVPPRDAAALAQAIECLLASPALRQQFGDASRQRAIARFDLGLIARDLRSLYRSLLLSGEASGRLEGLG